MVRGHDDGILGSDPGRDRLAHHAVDVPVSAMSSGSRSSVQKAMRPGPYSSTSGSSAEQVPRHRRLAHEEPHPGSEPLAALFDRECLVVRVDARGGICLELAPEDAGRVPVDVTRAVERELLELGRASPR